MHLNLMRDASTAFPKLESPEGIRSLRIWHCKYKSLKQMSACKNLEELVIATFPETSLDVISSFRALRYLSIVHLPKVSDLAPLTQLVSVESLSLSTLPSWDSAGKTSVVKSLEPVTGMTSLKHLELMGVCPADGSLAPLERCKVLQSARFARYSKSEVERFYLATGIANEFNPSPSFVESLGS